MRGKEFHMRMGSRKGLVALVAAAAVALAAAVPTESVAVSLTPVTYDEIIFASNGGTDPTLLSGNVEMGFVDNTLTVRLTNTSETTATTDVASSLLTGIGFNLPVGMSISSGDVKLVDGSVLYIDGAKYTFAAGETLKGEWGFDNSPLDSGGFLNLAWFSTNTVVSAMESQTEQAFGTLGDNTEPKDSLDNPHHTLNGPEMGLLSNKFLDPLGFLQGSKQNAVWSSIDISLNLLGPYSGDLVSYIDTNPVVLSFGSPNATTVPEPATMVLLGSGLLCICGVARRKERRG